MMCRVCRVCRVNSSHVCENVSDSFRVRPKRSRHPLQTRQTVNDRPHPFIVAMLKADPAAIARADTAKLAAKYEIPTPPRPGSSICISGGSEDGRLDRSEEH